MKLSIRLVLAFAAVAVLSVGVTGFLGYREAANRIPRALAEPGVLRNLGESERSSAGASANVATRNDIAGLGTRGQEVFLNQLGRGIGVAALTALGIALLVGSTVALRISESIIKLTTVTKRYGAGERTVRARLPGSDEIASLGRMFDETADRLEAEQALKQRFTTDVAHELRTPITVLKSELEAMQDGLMEATPERVADLLDQVNLLARLVQDLRTLTLVEAGALELSRSVIDLHEVARGSVESYRSAAQSAGIRLDVSGVPARVEGDADRLRQVIGNLLSNALRHTAAGGTVQVRTTTDDATRSVHLKVFNDGPPIHVEHLDHIFERFYRADASRRREDGGSGVGLAIVRALIEAHGGQVSAANVDQGVEFKVSLRLANDFTP